MKLAIFDSDNWREILTTLGRNKTRTFLTAFGIFWGTAMLAMLWGGADGLKGVMSRQFAGLSTNTGGLFPGSRGMSYRGFNRGSGWDLTLEDAATIRRVAPAIESMTTLTFASVTAAAGTQSKATQAMGVQPQYAEICTPVMRSGRFINASDEAGFRKVCVIGSNVANNLFPGQEAVGRGVNLSGIHYTVVGVASQRSSASIGGRIDDSILVPAATLTRSFNLGNRVDFLIYTAPAGHRPSDNEAAIRRALSQVHQIHPDDEKAFDFMDFSEMFDQINTLFLGLTILAIFVGLTSLLAGVIGVGNIMWIVVKERTHEFGVRRAIGAKPSDITAQVLSESILLTVVAGTAGVCFAALVLGIADYIAYDPLLPPAGFQISFGRAVGIVIAFIVLGSLAGTLPAVKAMKIKPIEALRTRN